MKMVAAQQTGDKTMTSPFKVRYRQLPIKTCSSKGTTLTFIKVLFHSMNESPIFNHFLVCFWSPPQGNN